MVEHVWAAIFDVDGVLVDSYCAHFQSWREMCAERGMEITEQQFAETFGRTSREVINRLWGNQVRSAEEVHVLDERKEAIYREILHRHFPRMDGAMDLIDRLYGAGFRLGVGSSGPPHNVFLVLDSLGCRNRFRAIVTGEDVTRGKPDPQVFLLAAERLRVPPARCVVFEDAPPGISAAHAAGMKCVALVSTGRNREELQQADRIVSRLSEVDVDDVIAMIDAPAG